MLEAIFSKINRSRLTCNKTQTVIYNNYVEDFIELKVKYKILHLLSEQLWYNVTLMLSYISVSEAFINVIILHTKIETLRMRTRSDLSDLGDFCWMINAILCIVSKRVQCSSIQLLAPRARHLCWYILDILIVFPFESFTTNLIIKRYIGLKKALQIFTVTYLFDYLNRRISGQSLMQKLLQFYYYFSYSILSLACVASYVECSRKDCTKSVLNDKLIYLLTIVTDQVTTQGVGLLSTTFFDVKVIALVTTLVVFIAVTCTYVAKIAQHFFMQAVNKSEFKFRYEALKLNLVNKNMPEMYMKYIDEFFDVVWKQCEGYEGHMGETHNSFHVDSFRDILPYSKIIELQTDISWEALAHSQLFNNLSIEFLKLLASVTRTKVYMKGQYIYHRNKMKRKMIYVSSGSLNILSEEDGETPLITLVEGTILGEISLLISYKSRTSVQCGSTVVLKEIERKDFLQIAMMYPETYKIIQQRAYKRYKDAIIMHGVKQRVNIKQNEIFNRSLSLKWIIHTLHKVMGATSRDNTRRHSVQNYYLSNTWENYDAYLFQIDYLQMLTIKDRISDDTDTLFIRSTFPHILRPNTGLILFWNVFITTLAVLAGLIIPYLCLIEKKQDVKFFGTIYLFTFLWLLDIVIKWRIAIRVDNQLITKPLYIFFYSFTNPTFILDMCSVLPTELFASLLVSDWNETILYLNRVLKLYSVFSLLRQWDGLCSSNPVYVRAALYPIIVINISYLLGCSYFYTQCIEKCDFDEFVKILFYAFQMTTGLALFVPVYSDLKAYYMLNIFVMVGVAVGEAIASSLFYSAYLCNVKQFMSMSFVLNKFLAYSTNHDERINAKMHTHMNLSNGLEFLYRNYVFNNIPKPLIGYFYEYHYLDWFSELPFFKGIPKEFVLNMLVEVACVRTVIPGEVIMYVGDLTTELQILSEGFCEMVSGRHGIASIVANHRALNDIEMCLNIPVMNTYMAATHCEIIHMNYREMLHILMHYTHKRDVFGFNLSFTRIRNAHKQYSFIQTRAEHFQGLYSHKQPNYIVHTRSHPHYTAPFAATHHSLLRFILMNVTLLPEGKLLFYWQIVRSICGLLSAFLYPTTSLIFLPATNPILLFMYLLNLIAIFDLYLRCHVGYYNKDGLLVTHPLYTATHYAKNGFFIDAIAAIPVHQVVFNNSYILLNCNKILEVHHYISLIRYMETARVRKCSKFFMFKYIPILVICVNLMTTIHVMSQCTMNKNRMMLCGPDTSFKRKAIDNQIYTFYVIISSVTTISMQGFNIMSKGYWFILLLALFGYYWRTFLYITIFSYFANDYFQEHFNNIHIESIQLFMRSRNIKANLQQAVERYIHLLSHYTKRNAHMNMKPLQIEIQRDTLYDRFSKHLQFYCLYGSADVEPFLRNLLVRSHYDVGDKGSYLVTINDIMEDTIILYGGCVELVGPDGRALCVLNPGSIFGNLCNMKYNRMSVTIISTGFVELIKIPALKFFDILRHFPATQQQFCRLKHIHLTHIPGYSRFKYPRASVKTRKSRFVILKVKWPHYCLFMALLGVGAYLAPLLYCYQTAVAEYWTAMLLPTVICDVCYIASIGVMFLLPVKEHDKFLVTYKEIFNHWKSRKVFLLCVFAGLPLNYILLIIPLSRTAHHYTFLFLRANVLLRYVHFFNGYNKYNERFNEYRFEVKYCRLIITLPIICCALATIILLFAEFATVNMNKRIDRKQLIEGSDHWKKFMLYFNYLLVIFNAVMYTSQSTYYPITTFYFFIMVVMMFILMCYVSIFVSYMVRLLLLQGVSFWQYIRRVSALFSYMRTNDASGYLSDKIHDYCTIIWNSLRGDKYPYYLAKLPPYLKEALYEFAFRNVIDCHPIFGKCHTDFRRQLTAKLQYDYYYCGDYVQYKGIIDKTMYWVDVGEVVAIDSRPLKDSVVAVYKSGDTFGTLQGLLHRHPHTQSYRATKSTRIVYLCSDDWSYLKMYFPASRAIIEEESKRLLDDEM